MAICELDSDDSLCKNGKLTIVRVHLDSIEGLEEYAEYDPVVANTVAKKVLGDVWDQFLKRNKLDGDQEYSYLDKLKKEADREILIPHAEKRYTGWFEMIDLPAKVAEEVLSRKDDEDLLTGWDMISFDEMNSTCAACKLSWDKGRGCIGTFGPDSSLLPGIAEKYGCEIIASVPKLAENGKKLSTQDAKRLLEEIALLREKLPDEGKMMVRRYGGVIDRLEKMVEVCTAFGTRFYFI